jgi:hypothetical protein
MNDTTNNISDEKIAEMLTALPRAAAPTDFEIGVRRRIAQGRPERRTAWLIPASAGIALMLMLAMVPAVWIAFRSGENAPVSSARPAVAEPAPAEPIRSQPAVLPSESETAVSEQPADARVPQNEFAVAEPPARPVGPQSVQRPTATQPLAIPIDNPGSIDRAISPIREPAVPRGLSTPDVIVPQPTPENKVKVPVREVLQMIGIDAEFSGGNWVAKSVEAASLAGRSGVSAGDAVIAINGGTLASDSTFEGGFNGRTITVKRGDETRTIELRNR